MAGNENMAKEILKANESDIFNKPVISGYQIFSPAENRGESSARRQWH